MAKATPGSIYKVRMRAKKPAVSVSVRVGKAVLRMEGIGSMAVSPSTRTLAGLLKRMKFGLADRAALWGCSEKVATKRLNKYMKGMSEIAKLVHAAGGELVVVMPHDPPKKKAPGGERSLRYMIWVNEMRKSKGLPPRYPQSVIENLQKDVDYHGGIKKLFRRVIRKDD